MVHLHTEIIFISKSFAACERGSLWKFHDFSETRRELIKSSLISASIAFRVAKFQWVEERERDDYIIRGSARGPKTFWILLRA